MDEFNRQLKVALFRIAELERNAHGLKVSRGKAIAAKNRALSIIANAKDALNTVSLN